MYILEDMEYEIILSWSILVMNRTLGGEEWVNIATYPGLAKIEVEIRDELLNTKNITF